MKIKQIKTILLTCMMIASTCASVLSLGSTVQAYKCPTGQEFHSSDNSCWKKDIGKTNFVGAGKGTVCSNGVTYKSTDNPPCVNYTRTTVAPTYEDGSAATFSCAKGTYHPTDNKCYTYELPPQCVSENTKNCQKEYVDQGYPKTISKDYKADYCGDNFPQETEACKSGQSSTDCSQYIDATQKDACAEGAATKLCGVNTGGGTEASAGGNDVNGNLVGRAGCYKGVKDCISSDQSTADQQKCLAKVSGVDKSQIDKGNSSSDLSAGEKQCGEAKTNLIACGEEGGVTAISSVLKIFINVLTVIIAIAAVGGLAWASITYARAEDNSGLVSEARTLIRNILIGILLYGFMVAIINWLVPGGVIG